MSEPTPSQPPAPVVPSETPRKPWLVGILYYGGKDPEHDRCVNELRKHPIILDVLDMTGCPYIDMGRSIIATHVLDRPDVGGLLFIDHDMIFEAKEVIRLIEATEAAQATHGAAYSMRRPGRIIGHVDGSKLAPGQKVVFFEGGEPLPAAYVGMGMTAIHRSVFERLVAESERHWRRQKVLVELLRKHLDHNERAEELLAELEREHLVFKRLPRLSTGISDAPVVPFFSHLQRADERAPEGTEGFYFGEDVSFCIRQHDHEMPVRLDTRVRVYHKGPYHYGLEDVGMEVPLMHRLEVLDTPNPKVSPGVPNEAVRQVLDSTTARVLPPPPPALSYSRDGAPAHHEELFP